MVEMEVAIIAGSMPSLYHLMRLWLGTPLLESDNPRNPNAPRIGRANAVYDCMILRVLRSGAWESGATAACNNYKRPRPSGIAVGKVQR